MDVSVHHVTVEFDNPAVRVLGEVSLTIEAGEHVALLGPSGSGKTTLLRLLLGAVELPAGKVRVGGRNPLGSPDEVSWLRRRTGCVRQRDDLIAVLTGRTNALMSTTPQWRPADWLALARGRAPRRYSAALQLLAQHYGVEDCLPAQVQKLSGGQRQRIALVRALLHQPQLLLADEATAGLDPHNTDIVIDGVLESTRTVIAATHDLSVAARFPRVVALRDGGIQYDGPPPGQDILDGIYAPGEVPACV
ncbi:MAG: ATP-binding cassette domain-containing protein [Streptomyces sp.]|uniref:ATP-binding cassette domain-containing protein n=1 Tax=Streptomyces sp. TaxID=1931 RepID=UPI003D6C695E